MAMPVSVSKPIVGVDVAKNEQVIYHAEADLLETIANNKAAIKKWLKTLSCNCLLYTSPSPRDS